MEKKKRNSRLANRLAGKMTFPKLQKMLAQRLPCCLVIAGFTNAVVSRPYSICLQNATHGETLATMRTKDSKEMQMKTVHIAGGEAIFLAPFWGGPLFSELYLGEGCDLFFSLYLYNVSQMIFMSSFS